MTCDYCDDGVPVVCGECGVAVETWVDGRIIKPASHQWTGKTASFDHRARPVHRIPDPEGYEGTAVVPCAAA